MENENEVVARWLDRRQFLCAVAATGAALVWTSEAFAKELTKTPRAVEGPYYPDRLPLDRNNDLVIVGNSITPAVGTITHLTGRVLDTNGAPVRSANIDIWQTDSRGSYLHSRGANRRRGRDPHFQGYGRTITDAKGNYRFRTIKPVSYPGRTPHIHMIVWKGRRRLLTTQLYIQGDRRNLRDGLYRSIPTAEQRQLVTIPFLPIKDSRIGELSANADVIVGVTPVDRR